MAEEKKIATGYIGNALRSAADNHTTTFADEVFYTERQKYQNEVNTDLESTDNEIKADLEAETARAKAAEQANTQAIAEEKAAIMGTDRIADGAVTIEKVADSAVDDEPTAGSDNLVKSGGVANDIAKLSTILLYTNLGVRDNITIYSFRFFVNGAYYTFINGKTYRLVILTNSNLNNVNIRLTNNSSAESETTTQQLGTYNFKAGELTYIDFTCSVDGCQFVRTSSTINSAKLYIVSDNDNIDYIEQSLSVLEEKISEGYLYKGIVTPSVNPEIPTGKVFYMVKEAGTYTNFDNIVVSNGISILCYNGKAWYLDEILVLDEIPTQSSGNGVTSGGVASAINIVNQAVEHLNDIINNGYVVETENYIGTIKNPTAYANRVLEANVSKYYTFVNGKKYRVKITPTVSTSSGIKIQNSSSTSSATISQDIGTFNLVANQELKIDFTCNVDECQFFKIQPLPGADITFYEVVETINPSLVLRVKTIENNIDIGLSDLSKRIEELNIKADFYDYSKMIPIKVRKAGGDGYFSTIQDAINSIKDASPKKMYDIQVYDDYEMTSITDLWKMETTINPTISEHISTDDELVTYHSALVIPKNWIVIRGMGERKKLTFASPTSVPRNGYQHIQTIYGMGNFRITNFYVAITGGRYALHVESGGKDGSLDYNANQIYDDCVFEHFGNENYPNNEWTSPRSIGIGTCSGLAMKFNNCKGYSFSDNSISFHTNGNSTTANFEKGNDFIFKNCQFITKHAREKLDYTLSEFNNFGSGMPASVTSIHSNLLNIKATNTMNYGSSSKGISAGNYWASEVRLKGYGNNRMLIPNKVIPNVLIFKTVENNKKIKIVGGTAKDLIFGGEYKNFFAADAVGISVGSVRIEDDSVSRTRYLYSLAYMLGNCAETNKTLIIDVDGTEYTIIFNKNYMTEDGSSYTSTTVPYLKLTDIISDINAIAPSVFSCGVADTLMLLSSWDDCQEEVCNGSDTTFNIGDAIIRDVATGLYRKALVGDTDILIAGERIDAVNGNIRRCGLALKADKNIFELSDVGISETTIKGTLFGVVSLGTIGVVTENAIFKAIDESHLISI